MAKYLFATIHLEFYFDTRYGCADGDALKINQFHCPCFSKVFGDPEMSPICLIQAHIVVGRTEK